MKLTNLTLTTKRRLVVLIVTSALVGLGHVVAVPAAVSGVPSTGTVTRLAVQEGLPAQSFALL